MARYCEPCETPFSSIINEQEHENSPAHKKKVEQRLREREISESLKESRPAPVKLEGPETHDHYMKAIDKNQYFCELCKANCAGKIPAFTHIRGKQHCQKLKQIQFSPEMASLSFLSESFLTPGGLSSVDNEPGISTSTEISPDLSHNRVTGHYTCKVCGIRMSGPTPARDHLQGKAHLKKLRIAREIGYNSEDLSDSFRGLSTSGSQLTNMLPTAPAREKTSFTGADCQADTKASNALDTIPETVSDAPVEPTIDPGNKQVEGDQTEENGVRQTTSDGTSEDIINKYREDLIPEGTMYKCSVCSVPLNGEKTIEQHFTGKAHLKKKRESMGGTGEQGTQLPEDVEKIPGSGKFRCTVCNVDVTGTGPLREHLFGKAHLKNKQVPKAFSLPTNLSGITVTSNLTIGEGNTGQDSTTRTDAGGFLAGTSADGNAMSGKTVAGNGPETKSPWNTTHPRGLGQNGNDISLDGRVYSHTVTSARNNMNNSTASKDQNLPMLPDTRTFFQTTTATTADPASPSPSTARPPPGFEGVSAGNTGQAYPMADFLNHQKITSETHPSRMHQFWSLSPENRNVPGGIPWEVDQVNPSVRLAPIGTPFQNAPTRGSQPQEHSCDSLRTEFTYNSQTMKYSCNTCRIDVTGWENARAHLQGSKHAKKARALNFQKHHMPSPVTAASPINTRPQPPPLATSDQATPPASHQPSNAHPSNSSGSSIEVLPEEERVWSSSFELSHVSGAGFLNHSPGASTGGFHVSEYDSGVPGVHYENNEPARSLRGVSMYTSQN